MDWYLLTRRALSTCRRSSIGAKHGQQFKHICTQCLQFATSYRFQLRFHLLMTNIHLLFNRPPKQANHRLPSSFRLLGQNQMKEPRSEIVHSSRRINSNLFIQKSKTGSNELSIIFACITDKSVVQIGTKIVFIRIITYMMECPCRSNGFTLILCG